MDIPRNTGEDEFTMGLHLRKIIQGTNTIFVEGIFTIDTGSGQFDRVKAILILKVWMAPSDLPQPVLIAIRQVNQQELPGFRQTNSSYESQPSHLTRGALVGLYSAPFILLAGMLITVA